MAPPVVVKIGGSLLKRPDFSEAIAGWLEEAKISRPESHLFLLVGGGELVDQLRALSSRHRLAEQTSHWLAIDLMEINLRIVASLFPRLEIVRSLEDCRSRQTIPGVTLLDAGDVLRLEEPQAAGPRLEQSWRVTSDSIAARLAGILAAELILLKESAPPDSWRQGDFRQLASLGFVDASFPTFSSEILGVSIQRIIGPDGASH